MTHDVGEDGRSFFSAAAAADASLAFFSRKFLPGLEGWEGVAIGLLSKQDVSSESGFFGN